MAQRSSVNSVVRMGIGTPGGNRPCQELTDTANMRQRQSCRPGVRPIATRKKACGSSPDNGANWPNKPSVESLRPQSLERPDQRLRPVTAGSGGKVKNRTAAAELLAAMVPVTSRAGYGSFGTISPPAAAGAQKQNFGRCEQAPCVQASTYSLRRNEEASDDPDFRLGGVDDVGAGHGVAHRHRQADRGPPAGCLTIAPGSAGAVCIRMGAGSFHTSPRCSTRPSAPNTFR